MNEYKRGYKIWIAAIYGFIAKPEKVFCLLGLSLGGIMIFLLPLFRAPDEMAHFARAYQVSQGQVFSQTVDGHTGGVVPLLEGYSFYNKLTSSTYKFFDFSSSAVYSPVNYIPQSVGIFIGNLLHPSVAVMVYMGRIFNLVAYIIMLYVAIKTATRGKWVYVVVGLLPMAVQQASSLSGDVMTIGPIFIFIALAQRLFVQATRITQKQTIGLIVLSLIIGLTKQTNVILLLSLLFLPKTIFESVWHKYRIVLLTIGIGFLSLIGWYMITRMLHYNFDYATMAGVNRADQFSFIFHHPLAAISALLRTLVIGGQSLSSPVDFISISLVGYFSWFDYKLPLSLIVCSYLLLFVALLYKETGKIKESKRLVWVYVIIFILSIGAIAEALYVSWTPVGYGHILGIQGRYFLAYIPLLIPLFAWLSRYIKVSFDKPHRMGMLVTGMSFINLTTMILLTYNWFY